MKARADLIQQAVEAERRRIAAHLTARAAVVDAALADAASSAARVTLGNLSRELHGLVEAVLSGKEPDQ